MFSYGLRIIVLRQRSRIIQDQSKVKCLLQSPIFYLINFSTGFCLVSKFHMWIVSIYFLQVFLPYSGSRPSIFLFPKLISCPYIITIHCLCISLSVGLPWIDCCISQIRKMLLSQQENMVCIRLLLGLLFRYLYHHIQIIYPQMAVSLSSSQMRWVSGTIW